MSTTIMMRQRGGAWAFAIAATLGFATASFAQTPFFPFVDDFATPFDDDPVTWVGGTVIDNLGNAVVTQVNQVDGGIALSNPAQLDPIGSGPSFSLGIAYPFKDGLPVIDGDVRGRAVLQVSDAQTYGSLAFRAQDYPPAGDAGAYFANINGEGTLLMGDFFDPDNYRSVATGLDPVASPVVLEFQVVGNLLTASAWDAAVPRPISPPSVSLADDVARPPAVMALDVGRFGTDPAGATATFYSYEVVGVPEPSSWLLAMVSVVGLVWAGYRRRANSHY